MRALAKLIVMKDALSAELEERYAEHRQANDPERRGKLAERALQVHRLLDIVQKDGDAINPHCTATPEELQTAIEAHGREFRNTFHEVLGREYAHAQGLKAVRVKLRRLST